MGVVSNNFSKVSFNVKNVGYQKFNELNGVIPTQIQLGSSFLLPFQIKLNFDAISTIDKNSDNVNVAAYFVFIAELCKYIDKIIAKILAVSKNRTDTRIYVRGDQSINYGRVLEVMGMLSGSGFTNDALITNPYKERK